VPIPHKTSNGREGSGRGKRVGVSIIFIFPLGGILVVQRGPRDNRGRYIKEE
jgi:hypothetical protein